VVVCSNRSVCVYNETHLLGQINRLQVVLYIANDDAGGLAVRHCLIDLELVSLHMPMCIHFGGNM